MPGCVRFSQFMEAQYAILKEHIDKHAWYQHIKNKEEAILDFVDKYGWMFREAYCRGCNNYKNNKGDICEAYMESLK